MLPDPSCSFPGKAFSKLERRERRGKIDDITWSPIFIRLNLAVPVSQVERRIAQHITELLVLNIRRLASI